MRAALALLLLTCTAPPPTGGRVESSGGSVELRTIITGGYASAKPEAPQAIPATDEATYRRLWPTVIGGGDPPPVDFANESVVFLLAGEKTTGGWSVNPRGAEVEGETLVVDAAIQGPTPESVVSQAFTSPFAVITVNTKTFKDVRWKR